MASCGPVTIRATTPPFASINFVTAHDGFTLEDLVSYNDKHNEANGESNLDGSSDNLSWNCGAEAPTSDRDITKRREQQKRNLMAMLLLSQGVPMIDGGDEIGRTQRGNNRGRRVTDDTLLVLLNAHDQTIPFTLPQPGHRQSWTVVVDTAESHLKRSRIRRGWSPQRVQPATGGAGGLAAGGAASQLARASCGRRARANHARLPPPTGP